MTKLNMIEDPADRLTPEFLAALSARYADGKPRRPQATPEQFANACDAVIQLLWPEQYDVDLKDPFLHSSDPARQIARAILDAAGDPPR